MVALGDQKEQEKTSNIEEKIGKEENDYCYCSYYDEGRTLLEWSRLTSTGPNRDPTPNWSPKGPRPPPAPGSQSLVVGVESSDWAGGNIYYYGVRPLLVDLVASLLLVAMPFVPRSFLLLAPKGILSNREHGTPKPG